MKECFFAPYRNQGVTQAVRGCRATEASSGNLALLSGLISDSITLDQLGPGPLVFIES